MKILRPTLISLGVVAGMAAASAWALSRIGADTPIATHIGLNGPDRFAPAKLALWAHPGMALLVTGLFAALPSLMPKNARLERSASAYETVWLAVLVVLAATEAAVVAGPLGVQIDPTRMIPAVIGALLLVMGNLLGKIRYNYVFGVRTPWTLSNERVWDKTHRFMGPWFAAWGAALLLCALFAPLEVFGLKTTVVVTLGGLAVILALAVGYSYLASRKLEATPTA
jgi:uncharacterized membrane protein